MLLAAYESTAGLTPYGNAELRGWVRGALTARLLSEAAFNRAFAKGVVVVAASAATAVASHAK